MQRWNCVCTQPRAEIVALEHLQRQVFECFLPRILRTLLRGGRRQSAVDALFPRYLFLRADVYATSVAPVRSTRGAVGLVRIAGEPAAVPDELSGRLRADADSDGVITLPDHSLQTGDVVMIIEGPLEGMKGVYAEGKGASGLGVASDPGRHANHQCANRCFEAQGYWLRCQILGPSRQSHGLTEAPPATVGR